MKVIYVTSEVTYVKDNYFYLIEKITDKDNISKDIEIAAVFFLDVPLKLLFKNIFGLMIAGAAQVSFTLAKNLAASVLNDKRKKMLQDRNIKWYQVKSINLPETVNLIKSIAPDLIVNMRTRNIYKKHILDLPRIGCINIHHGLLPDNRGTMCDLWAWTEKRPVGFSIHWMNEKIDDGTIIARKQIPAAKCNSYIQIPLLSSHYESEVLINSLAMIEKDGKKVGIPNISSKVRHTRNPNLSQIEQIRRMGLRL